jgi:hypothetical protein
MRRRTIKLRAAGLLLALSGLTPLFAAPLAAQTPLDEMPGYFPLELLSVLAPEDVSIEINLRGAMLRMISSFTGDEDPEFAALVAGLDAVHVRSGEFDPAEMADVSSRVAAGQRWLRDNGWLAMLRVQDEGDEIYIYTREMGVDIVGLAILALESGEATAINLIGRIDPDQIGRLAEGFAVGSLEDLQERIDQEVDR